ncbi:MAG: hypothetical protein HUK01_08320 [Bacteroidaceae bacterium]|nr:hypothetical protein [Bacteroidaceae bacterium]
MTKKLIATLLTGMMWTCAWAGDVNALIVTTKDGGRVVYALSEKPEVTFTATEVVLTVSEAVVAYPLADQVLFTFGDKLDAISRTAGLRAVITYNAGELTIGQVAAGMPVRIATIDGREVADTQADAAGNATVRLPQATTYVVQVGDRSFKLQCK